MTLFSVIQSHSHLTGNSTDGVGPRKKANSQDGQGCYFHGTRSKFCEEAEHAFLT